MAAGARPEGRLDLQVLGPLQARLDGVPVDLGSPKQRCVLALLALHAGAVVPRDRLVDAIWGEDGISSRAHALQTYISGIRSVLGQDRVATHGHGYALTSVADELDLSHLRRLRQDAHAARERGATAEAIRILESAVDLVHGDVVADVADRMERLDAVHAAEDEVAGCREELASLLLETDRSADALEAIRPVRSAQPLRETATTLELRALAASGRRPEALAAYESYRRTLSDQLGTDPSPSLQALHLELLGPVTDHPEPRGARPESDGTPARVPDDPPPPRPALARAARYASPALLLVAVALVVVWRLPGPPHESVLIVDAEPGWVGELLTAGRDRAVSELDVTVTQVLPLRGEGSVQPWLEAACRGEVDALVFGSTAFFPEVATAVACGVEDVTLIDTDDSILGQPWAERTTRIRLRSQEAAFLAGIAAATTSRSQTVGIIAGMDIPPVEQMVAGFAAGARHAREDTQVLVQYLAEPWAGDEQFQRAFYDPNAGRAAAGVLTDAGADVIFAVAGISGEGALAVAERERADASPVWVIGVDSDWQRFHGPRHGDVILGSVTKALDVAVFEAIRDDLRTPGGARRIDLGLAVGAVDFVDTRGNAADSVGARDRARRAIIRDEIDVPSSYAGPALPMLSDVVEDR